MPVPTAKPPDPPRRPRLRCSLRFLIVLVAVAACLIAWVTGQARRCQEEDRVVRALSAAHGLQGGPNVVYQNGPHWLAKLLGRDWLRKVIVLACYAPGNTFSYGRDDAGHIRIERQYVAGLTNDEVATVARLHYLRSLFLEAHPTGDDGLQSLQTLQCLEDLNLSNTAISDSAAGVFPKLPALRTLDVSRTDLTDSSVPLLAKCRNLRKLNIEMTNISSDGVATLQRQLPDCEISR